MPGMQMRGDRKAERPMRTLGRLLAYTFSHNRLKTVFMVIFVLLASAASVTSASFVAPIIEALGEFAVGTITDASELFSVITPYIIIMACVYFAGGVSQFAYNLIMMYIAQATLRKMRNDMFVKMQSLQLSYFDSRTHGNVMSLYTNDVDTMRQLLTQSIPQLISAVLTFLFIFSFMVYYSFMLTLIVLAFVAVVVLLTGFIGGRSSREFIKQQKVMGRLNGFVEEMTEGQKVIKVFCHEEEAKEDFGKVNDELNEASCRANTYSFILGPINNNLGWLEYVLVAVMGIIIIGTGNYGLLLSSYVSEPTVFACAGMLVSFMMFARQFNQPVQQVSQQFNAIVMALAGAERIFAMMDTASEDTGGEITLTRGGTGDGEWAWKKTTDTGDEYIPLRGDIRFNNVYFGYTDDKVILKDISLYAKPTQKIAFVGSTGAGKTTVINLISRFYDIQGGSITYDGIPIKDINKADLRRSFGIVLQDTHLFTASVLENIRYGRLSATDDECMEAARLANADTFIKHLPEGYDTVIMGDGSNLSQGQRQLLAIARAMVSECPVLILDEATSSIDTRTERLINEGLDKLMEGRTVFIIAHRLSTVRGCHAIMVLEHGEIIERGTHEQLLDRKGMYYRLYTGDFELD